RFHPATPLRSELTLRQSPRRRGHREDSLIPISVRAGAEALRRFAPALAAVCFFMVQAACAPSAPDTGTSTGAPQSSIDEGANKTLVIAHASEYRTLGPFGSNSTAGGGATIMGVHSTGLVNLDAQGNETAWVAAAIPSLNDGSVVLLPDGRMRTTWRLRPDVTWHDGSPLTADDLAFTQDVRSGIVPGNPENVSPFIERVDVVDPLTAAITWKTTYYNALVLDFRSFWLLPKHLLVKSFEEDSSEAFLRNPYFTNEYVNLGPFRLLDWGLGQDMTFERYPGYFMGIPKVGKLNIKTITDQNVIAAGLRSGTIDVVANKAISANLSIVLRDEWRGSNEGIVESRQENWIYLQQQWDTQWARPAEVPRDVRLRIGMFEALDRTALREFQFPGVPDTNGDSFVPAADSRGPVVGQPFARYAYDPNHAVQDLLQAGWTRAPDGRLLDRSGSPVQIEVRAGSPSDLPVLAVVADMWRRIGIDANEFATPPQATAQQTPENLQFPGVQLTGRGAAESALTQFESRRIPTAETRWTGQNTASYSNPDMDRLLGQLFSTLEDRERGNILKQIGDVMAADMPAIPLYWRISFMEVRNTVRGPLVNDHAHMGKDINGYSLPRSAHLWERA
ncbi:MAG TPA: ABC transporter substrate-binding protein, partial [Chloroflexota bacterium]